MDLPQAGRPIDDVLADLVAKRQRDARWADGRTFGLVYDGGPSVHEVAERAAAAFLHENALNTHAFPSLASIQNEVVGWTADLLARTADRRRLPDEWGYRVHPVRGARGPRAWPRRARHSQPARSSLPHRRMPRSTSRRICSACRSSPCRLPMTGPSTSRRWLPPSTTRPCSSWARRRSTRRASSTRSPIAELAASVGAWCHVDACMGGFVLPFAEMLGRGHGAVGLPRRGRALDLGRHPQARLRPQRRLRDRPSQQGAPALPDVDVRRMARWVLRLAQSAGHAVRRSDGGGVGGDAAPRGRRLRGADAADVGHRRPDARGGERDRRVCESSATRSTTCWRSRPTSNQRIRSTSSRSATRLPARGWYHDRQGPPDSLHSTVSAGNAKAVEEWVDDLRKRCRGRGHVTDDRSTSSSTID